MQTDLLRVLAEGGAKQQSRSKGTLPGNIVYQHLLGTFAISLRIPTPQIGPGTKHIDLLQIDSAGLDLEDRMFCKHFSKNMSMVSATHCCSNCAEADLPLCLPCVSLPIFFFLSSSFHYFSFSFRFLFYLCFHFIWRRHRSNSNWLVAMPRCLLCLSLCLCLCASSGFHRNHTLVIFGSCGHRRIDWPMMLDWKNWIYCRAANSLCTFFPSGVQQIVCGTITNRNWNRNRDSCCRRDSLWICPEFIIYFSLFFVGTMQVTTKVY